MGGGGGLALCEGGRKETTEGKAVGETAASVAETLSTSVQRMRLLSSPARFSGISGYNLEITEFVENP